MNPLITVFVPGRPVTQGNHRAGARGAIRETSKGHGAWRSGAAMLIRNAWAPRAPLDCAVAAEFWFWFQPTSKAKPGSLPMGTGGDLDKLVRCMGDALEQAGVVKNDRRIVTITAHRRFAWGAQPEGCKVSVTTIRE